MNIIQIHNQTSTSLQQRDCFFSLVRRSVPICMAGSPQQQWHYWLPPLGNWKFEVALKWDVMRCLKMGLNKIRNLLGPQGGRQPLSFRRCLHCLANGQPLKSVEGSHNYPLVSTKIAGWNITIFNRKYIFIPGPFSIAMLEKQGM